jgi:peptide chain release factor 2
VLSMDLKTRIEKLQSDIAGALERIGIPALEQEHTELRQQSQAADFWQDQAVAQNTMQRISKLQERLDTWQGLQTEANDLAELASLDDASLQADIESQYSALQSKFDKLKLELALSGPHDDSDVIVSIHAGAGGTDAQDWAAMLLRMYVRWAEAHKYKVTMLDESSGDEAGLKSVSFEIDGPVLYGKLRGEHGVHRLVRLSPFNANNLRQTSFAKVEVMPKIDRPEELPLDEKDLKIDVYRAGGHGGQSVNTTDSAVRVTHLPTGLVVSIQNERSQLQNKETALTILRSKLAVLQAEQHLETLKDLKGPNQSAEWGNQIRSYVLHPYKQVKDLRTGYETSDAEKVLDGQLDPFIDAWLEHSLQ